MWALTATADVAITDASALQRAAARLNEGFVITVPGADVGVEDSEPEAPEAVPVENAFDALAWLIWPSEGLEGARRRRPAHPLGGERGRRRLRRSRDGHLDGHGQAH